MARVRISCLFTALLTKVFHPSACSAFASWNKEQIQNMHRDISYLKIAFRFHPHYFELSSEWRVVHLHKLEFSFFPLKKNFEWPSKIRTILETIWIQEWNLNDICLTMWHYYSKTEQVIVQYSDESGFQMSGTVGI